MSEKLSSPDYSIEVFESMGDQELANTWRELRPRVGEASKQANDPKVGDPNFSLFLNFLQSKDMPTPNSSLDKGYPLLYQARMDVK